MKSRVAFLIICGFGFLSIFSAASFAQQSESKADKNPKRERSIKILTEAPDASSAPTDLAISSAQLEALNSTLKIDNAAGVSLDLIPGGEVIAGSKVGFQITAKKQGYLILLNIDAAGKLTQIFPNPLTTTGRDGPALIKPGKAFVIPQLGSPYATFEFVAEPPAGLAIFVALLSDKPVQLVDLPDAPPPAFAPGDTLKYVRDKTLTLILPTENVKDRARPSWSFDGKAYLIK